VADSLTLALLALGLSVAVFGGFRLRFDTVRLSFMSAPRLFAFALGVAVVRHLLVRREPLYARAARGLAALRRSEDLRAVLPLWAWTRIGVLAVGFFAVAAIGYPASGRPFFVYGNEVLNLPARFDAGWYFSIATTGYAYDPGLQGQQNIAFMPGLPMLMRVGGKMIGDQPLIAGQIVVLAACLWAFLYLYRLAREHLGDRDRALMAVSLAASYPFAVFLGAVYTESIFLLCATGAFYHARRHQPWQTAAFAFLAGVSRPNGFLLSVPVALAVLTPGLLPTWSAWRTWTPRRFAEAIRATWPLLLASAAGVAGVALFCGYIYQMTGHPLTWLQAHAAWGRTFTGAADFVVAPYHEFERLGAYEFVRSLPIDALNGLAAAVALVTMIPVTIRYGLAYGVFILINLLPPLMVGGWLSIGRVTLGLFPLYLWWAEIIPARQRTVWLVGFALFQGLAAALFYTWRPFI
jgi:hypothetical protein